MNILLYKFEIQCYYLVSRSKQSTRAIYHMSDLSIFHYS